MTLQEALKTTGDIKLRRQLWDYSMLALKIRQNNFFNIETNQIYTLTYLDIIADDWIVSELKCAHEPNEYDLNLAVEGGPFDVSLGAFNIRKISNSKTSLLGNCCKHCGVKIKAEKWVEA